jgi:hypothetical protein
MAETLFWSRIVVRLAAAADRPVLERLAELDSARPPAAPVLLGVVGERPVAALSLHDGRTVADPFVPTADMLDLLRLRAAQLQRATDTPGEVQGLAERLRGAGAARRREPLAA